MTKQALLTAARWLGLLVLAYAVIRLTIVISIPAYYVREEWVNEMVGQCGRNPSLCVHAYSQRMKVGRWWYGHGLIYRAQPGKAKELKALLVKDMPDKPEDRLFTPWNYIGIRVTEVD